MKKSLCRVCTSSTLKEFEIYKIRSGEFELPSVAKTHSIKMRKRDNQPRSVIAERKSVTCTKETWDVSTPTIESARAKRKAATRAREIWQVSLLTPDLRRAEISVANSSRKTRTISLQNPELGKGKKRVVPKDHSQDKLATPNSGRATRKAALRAREIWTTSLELDSNGNSKTCSETSNKSTDLQEVGQPEEIRSRMVVYDFGPQAQWVKISALETDKCYEVYALTPGLLREEVKVQTDPLGRIIIMGNPEEHNNLWGITCFKKVIILPKKTDPLRTTATILLNGRVFISAPFYN